MTWQTRSGAANGHRGPDAGANPTRTGQTERGGGRFPHLDAHLVDAASARRLRQMTLWENSDRPVNPLILEVSTVERRSACFARS